MASAPSARLTTVSLISPGLPKPLITTEAPAETKALAIPSPIPLVEPVTIATLPSRILVQLDVGWVRAMFMMSLLQGCLDSFRWIDVQPVRRWQRQTLI